MIHIVGAGLTGATIARQLTDAGHRVVVYEAREHVAGNCYDHLDRGLLVNVHGPHYFRTNSRAILAFAERFATWRPWEATVQSHVNNVLYPWPISIDTIKHFCGDGWRQQLYDGSITNFEQACLAKVPYEIYTLFIKGYTEKQWGTACENLSPKLANRFAPRQDSDPRFMQHKFQRLPDKGYAHWIEQILKGIPIEHDVRMTYTSLPKNDVIFFTGPIDHCFNYELGRLRYRTQRRTTRWFPAKHIHAVPQVNNPDPRAPSIREIDWSWIAPQSANGTLVTAETPAEATDPDELEYPFPDEANANLYRKYVEYARETAPNVVFCGRLGSFLYMDMDAAIGHGMTIARRWLNDFHC